MAREINGRIVVSGQLQTLGPLHVGTGVPSPETDLPLARNGMGELYVPGTSLAGALRSWCEDTLGVFEDTPDDEPNARVIREVFGPLVPKKTDQGRASYLFVEDARVQWGRLAAETEIRDGVAIDRQWGVAATRFKFDRAILPRGTRLDLRLILELPVHRDAEARGLLRHLVMGLRRGDVRLGAGKTRGMGRVRLDGVEQVRFEQVDCRAGILRILRDEHDPNDDPLAQATALNVLPSSRLEVHIGWSAVGPVMVKSGAEGLTVDMLPLLSDDGEGLAPVIPGSSIKGVLRGQSERIVRTVLGIDGADRWPDQPYLRFPAQLAEVPLVNQMFGAPGSATGESPAGQGALFVEDAYAQPLGGALGSDGWLSIGEDTNLRTFLNDAGRQDWTVAHHVAIDRWTGGAAEAFLYSVLEPWGEAWSPCQLALDLARLPESLTQPAVVLLLMLLRDLAAQRLPIGFAGNRGMGEVRITQIELAGATERAGLGAEPLTLPNGDLSAVPQNLRKSLTETWQAWLEEERGQL